MGLMDDDEWQPARRKMEPQFAALLVEDASREFDPEEMLKFFEQLAEDYGPMEIGLALGWSPAMVKRFVEEPSRAELIDMIQEAQHESVERGIVQAARAGNSTAMKIYAYNKMAHRGWQDRRQISITGTSKHEIVLSVKEALGERLGEIGRQGPDAIAALQAAYLEPDVPETDDVIDAEIVDDA